MISEKYYAQPKRVLAVASGGGHWKQLLRLRPVFDRHETTYLTTIDGLPQEVRLGRFKIVSDFNRDNKIRGSWTLVQMIGVFIRVRPQVVITTGAAPGLVAIAIGRLTFARTLWIDSIANGDELSMSGRLARKLAHCTVSQWQGVASSSDVDYWGQLL